MKLSEAIRLGAMATGRASGDFYKNGNTCALGAAFYAIGGLEYTDNTAMPYMGLDTPFGPWGWMHTRIARCPGCENVSSVRYLIPHLNNNIGHSWSRERIAAWVATIEPQEETPNEEATRALQTAQA